MISIEKSGPDQGLEHSRTPIPEATIEQPPEKAIENHEGEKLAENENGVFDKDTAADESSINDYEENGAEAKEPENPAPAPSGAPHDDKPQRSKGRMALIMLALGVCFSALQDLETLRTVNIDGSFPRSARPDNHNHRTPHNHRALRLFIRVHMDWCRVSTSRIRIDTFVGEDLGYLGTEIDIVDCECHIPRRVFSRGAG